MPSRTIDQAEINKFKALAQEWWDEAGKFKPLHMLNPVRLTYIKDKVMRHFLLPERTKPLSDLKILDVGCGGGLVSEPLARLGAQVIGIDATRESIKAARLHARHSGVKVQYIEAAIEDIANLPQFAGSFDVVLGLEIIEHVSDPGFFLQMLKKCLRDGGIMFISTLSRTISSFLLAIVGAEMILRWVPFGTHDWRKFINIEELRELLGKSGLSMHDVMGFKFKPLDQRWTLTHNTSVNYITCASSMLP